jgi:LAS superfamily LD-carboxypeptidase LdcB
MTAGGGAGGAYGLQKNAAGALAQLQGAYQARWGQPLVVNSGGRTFAEQTALYNSYLAGTGNLAAKPGTSVHESGLAVDFGGAAHGFGAQQTWLQQVAGQYGFSWTGKNFSQVEPWHFEYVGS